MFGYGSASIVLPVVIDDSIGGNLLVVASAHDDFETAAIAPAIPIAIVPVPIATDSFQVFASHSGSSAMPTGTGWSAVPPRRIARPSAERPTRSNRCRQSSVISSIER